MKEIWNPFIPSFKTPMATMMFESDVITLDESDEDLSSSGSSSPNIFQTSVPKLPANGTTTSTNSNAHATISILNEKPLDISAFLKDTSAPKPVIDAKPPTNLNIIKNGNISSPNFVSVLKSQNQQKITVPVNNSLAAQINRKRLSDVSKPEVKKPKVLTTPRKLTLPTHSFSNYYDCEPHYRSYDPTTDDFNGQFRCTALNCGKLLNNNVSFVYHLWAHVAAFMKRELSEYENYLTDEKWIRTCSGCQSIFDTPFEKTKHFMEVHRGIGTVPTGSFCHVCELVDHNGCGHKVAHKTSELPYECRKCKYKVSSRKALLVHYAKIHVGTTYLMCPFCPFTTSVLQTEKNKPIVFVKVFVNHMLEHGNVVAQRCSNCCYKFIDHDRFESHSKNHVNDKHGYAIQTKPFNILKQEMPNTKLCQELLTRCRCEDCNCQFLKADEHIGDILKCKKCEYSTRCQRAYWKHVELSDCCPEKSKRLQFYWNQPSPIKKPKIQKQAKKSLTICKSAEFRQNFAIEKDFDFDYQRDEKTNEQVDEQHERTKIGMEKLNSMLTTKKYKDLGQEHQAILLQSLMDPDVESEASKMIKKLRLPFENLFEYYLEQKKKENENDSMEE